MPFEIQYEAEGNFIQTTFTGKINMQVTREYIAQLLPILEETGCTRVLNDSRTANLQLSALDILQFPKMAEASPLTARCKRAVVPPPDTSGFDMYETLSHIQGQRLRVFKKYDDALEWLLSEEK